MKFCGPLVLLGLLPAAANAKAILGVDLGSLYMKVALVQRGSPLEIVTNLHSKRKTENMILFDANTRFYGADANSMYGRKPQKTPSSMTVFLGRDDQHPTVQVLAERHFPILPAYNETRSGVYLTVDKKEFTPEELVAMVLSHARDITVSFGVSHGNDLLPKDIVLTVPSFATQHERKAIMDAAELADFNVLALIEENTAAALHYGMDKIHEEPKTIIFYNLGASALQVSVVRFLSYKHKDSKYGKPKTVGGLEVLGKAWDATLGGLALDHRIVETLADEFNAKWGQGDVRKYPRAMAKLRIQSNKIKHVLSANKEIPVYMESLHADTPLQAHFTREKMEEVSQDLLERAIAPIEHALKAANVTMDEIDGIELIGGGMRVPRIQQEIKNFLKNKMELGMHINSDESMALGAAFHGANISTAFKVRHVGLADVNPFPVSITLNDMDASNTDEEAWSKKATMFKSGGKMGIKKTIAFTHDKDVHCAIDYEESGALPEGTELSIERYSVTGISEFASEMEAKGLGPPKVSLQFEMSLSGITQLVRAEATVEETVMVQEEVEVEDNEEEEEEEKMDAAEGKGQKTETSEEAKEPGSETKDETAADVESNETKADESTKTKKKKTKVVEKEKKKLLKRSLSVDSFHVGRIRPYSPLTMEESRAKIEELARKDKERIMLEETRNKLESYIYRIKNKLSDDEEQIGQVSTAEQREEISKLASDAEDWLYEDGYNADLLTMEEKYAELSNPAEKIFFRVSEMSARPESISALKGKLKKIENLMTKWETTMPQVTEEERSDVLSKVESVKEWIAEMEKAQSEANPTEDPVFTSADVPLKSKPIESLVTRLNRKPKPKPPKKNETKAENATNTTDGEETEAKEEADSSTSTPEEEATNEEKQEPTGDEL